ncbi:2-oxoacid:ferredoxin oxidoreductase subunit alpha [Thermogymnomonas acidicola]|uniref:2-oxoglutarate synthase subunit KorA n=2 Tax=Thermogymnomonas acidicola TaxID=399579 RepID=A0AA37BSB8_9ARCH|nr:2-oxoacid:ferredoxin oxidoreductase subunit alpha [Thermogymnomonas acidicola]
MISRAFASSGYGVFGVREYHSNIKGRHSYIHLRIKEKQPRSLRYPVDYLVALDADTIFEHLEDVSQGTKVIYDLSFERSDLASARMIMRDTAERIRKTLEEGGYERNVKGALKLMEDRGARLIGVPFDDLVNSAVKEGPASRYFNTLGAAITLGIAGLKVEHTIEGVKAVFANKEQVVKLNVAVVQAAYEFCMNKGLAGKELPELKVGKRFLLTGNDGSAIGKVLGGLRFQTYYPITPASDESTILEEHEALKWIQKETEKLKEAGVVVVQTEDEISAVTMASGAALTGVRSATATSGPGFSLMAEGIGFAGMDEVPLVVTLYQRGGPSTGLPTRNGQSDLLFALNTGHGEFPRIVFSSGDVEECIYDAMKALNYAQRYQMPVIHMIDKNLANTMDLIPEIDRKRVKIVPPVRVEKEPFKRYDLDTDTGISGFGIFGRDIFWMTGDEHDELGHVTEDPVIRDAMMRKRFQKLVTADREIPLEDKAQLMGPSSADVTFVTWGSQKGPILDVIEDLKNDGVTANLLYLKMFSPFPSEFVSSVLKKAKLVINVESNMLAQAARVIRMNTGIEIKKHILKYNGRHMTEDEIYRAAKEIIFGKEEKVEEVLVNGA